MKKLHVYFIEKIHLAKVQGYSGVLGEENNKSGQKSFITK
jgi:hypothetical protein